MSVDVIRRTAASLIADADFTALRDEYAAECSLHGLPDPQEKLAMYQALDASGSFRAFGAYVDGCLVGFVTIIAPVLPHYGVAVAVAESLFVAFAHRKTGAGLALIRRAEDEARSMGSPAILFSSPSGGRLATLLPRIGYRETNRAYMKGFCHERHVCTD